MKQKYRLNFTVFCLSFVCLCLVVAIFSHLQAFGNHLATIWQPLAVAR
ncbi:hypothetical protein [Ostreibacterium oceani]|nr:hypothetical protein [Ostreibacterium oceani]